MRLEFTKMQGLGNDFVVIDAIHQPVSLSPEQIRFIADRHFGIGFDQLLLVESATRPEADFRYRIFNADGGEVAQCGNGARCFARFVRDRGLTEQSEIRVETHAGLLVLQVKPGGEITVNMGIPQFEPARVPLTLTPESLLYVIELSGVHYRFGALSLGNPHAVIQVEAVESAPVQSLGPLLESHPIFPERANIGFMQRVDPHRIRLRVFERGSGETLACGSGACAAAVLGIEQGILTTPVRVELPGGALSIDWAGRDSPVMMTGPATTVFQGEIEL